MSENSSLDDADIDVMKATKTCVSANRFQYDYLNDDIDDFGNIDESTIVGTNTNSKTEYTYDNTTKLLTNLKYTDFNNGGAYDEYTYSYDSYKRLLATEENKFGSFYQRVTLYDAFGRPEKESYNAIAAGKQSTKWIKNTYKNKVSLQSLYN